MSDENLVTETKAAEADTEDTILYNETNKAEGEKSEETEDKPETKEVEGESKETTDETTESKEIEYKLELQETTSLDNSAVEDAISFAKEHNLSNDTAQAILTKQENTIKEMLESAKEFEENQSNEWRKQTEDDSVLGGENLAATTESARKVLSKFGSEGFVSILRDTGYGNHPEVIRFLSSIGKTMADDTLILAEAKGESKSIEEIFYGSNN